MTVLAANHDLSGSESDRPQQIGVEDRTPSFEPYGKSADGM